MPKKDRNISENQYFDTHMDQYAEEIMAIQPTFFQNAGNLINQKLKSGDVVLDIGNGGVINYRFDHLQRLVCGDLTISQTSIQKYASNDNVEFTEANILDLGNIPDEMFDAIIVQAVIHHLAGRTLAQTHKNVDQAIAECMRALKKGGQLLIVESTVNGVFECIERLLYPLMQLFFKICKFDCVYQYSARSLVKKLGERQSISEYAPIDVGPWIWIMGKRAPRCLTPCGAVWIRICK